MAYNTIKLMGEPIRKELPAAGTITPGDLIERTSAGKYQRHSTALGKAQKIFAFENELFANDITVDYVAGPPADDVLGDVYHSGCEVYATLAPSAAAIVIGDFLESAGNGTLRKLTTGVHLASALEAIDNSAGASKVHIRVEIA